VIAVVTVSASERETAVVAGSEFCGACQQRRLRGHCDPSGKVFICSQCLADAEQFVRIQDTGWGAAPDRTDSPSHIEGQAI
jgi:hypothetical protein